MAETIEQFMTPCPHSVGAEQSLQRAIEAMRKHRVRHMPVLHGGELVGVLSDRDIVLLEGLTESLVNDMTVEEAMSTEPYAVPKETPLKEVLGVMASRHLGSAIVVNGNKVVGIYTSTDAVRMLSERL